MLHTLFVWVCNSVGLEYRPFKSRVGGSSPLTPTFAVFVNGNRE